MIRSLSIVLFLAFLFLLTVAGKSLFVYQTDSLNDVANEAPREKQSFAVMPNPNDGSFAVQYELMNDQAGKVIVSDIRGIKQGEYILEPDKKFMIVNLKGINNGVYIVRIQVNSQIEYTQKITVVRQ